MDEQKKRLYGLVRECRVLKDYYYKLARKAKTQSDVDTYTRWAGGHEHDENVLIHVAMVLYGQTLGETLSDINNFIAEYNRAKER